MAGRLAPNRSTREALRSADELAQLAEHRAAFLEDIAVGEAAKVVAARVRLALAAAILLPGVARGVVAEAVELDG